MCVGMRTFKSGVGFPRGQPTTDTWASSHWRAMYILMACMHACMRNVRTHRACIVRSEIGGNGEEVMGIVVSCRSDAAVRRQPHRVRCTAPHFCTHPTWSVEVPAMKKAPTRIATAQNVASHCHSPTSACLLSPSYTLIESAPVRHDTL